MFSIVSMFLHRVDVLHRVEFLHRVDVFCCLQVWLLCQFTDYTDFQLNFSNKSAFFLAD